MTSKSNWLFIISLTCAVSGCDGQKLEIGERLLPSRNPTTYEFHATIETVVNAVNSARGEKWSDTQKFGQRPELVWNNARFFSKPPIQGPRATMVAYLGSKLGDAIADSHVYIKNDKELPFYADLKIRLYTLSSNITRVEVIAENCRVLAGTEWHPFARAGIFLEVDGTTIEEYQILLDVGRELGEPNMPELILPDKTASIHKIRRPRMK